jgi:BirA family biotin operon repressor/biotin-[acetyl-CoA-carboxylase] ligase
MDLAPHLATRQFGRNFIFLTEADSTNKVAMELASQGAPEGMVVCADRQTAGRGRQNRAWFSPSGSNLYVSLVLRPSRPAQEAVQVALVGGLAVAAALQGFLPAAMPAKVKWPNDVFVGGRKCCGLLCEMSAPNTPGQSLVVGIGVNVNLGAEELAPGLRGTATSLRMAAGKEFDRAKVLAAILLELERRYSVWLQVGLAGLMPEWRDRSLLEGHRVVAETAAGEISGTVAGLSGQGNLLVRNDAGETLEISAGDVHIRSIL